jgi:hypothetical protein
MIIKTAEIINSYINTLIFYENTGAFQLCTASDRTWIHSDCHNMWAGVCYLTPNAPLSSGTAFYMHKKTGNTSDCTKLIGLKIVK